jgi:hypothetical protein
MCPLLICFLLALPCECFFCIVQDMLYPANAIIYIYIYIYIYILYIEYIYSLKYVRIFL